MAKDAAAYGPSRWRIRLFLGGMTVYYVLWVVLFADRMGDYLRDLERHFEFARPAVGILRRLLGAP
ncbi:MAG: hypothetical protein ACK44W_04580 [Planctomycetota bacterium]